MPPDSCRCPPMAGRGASRKPASVAFAQPFPGSLAVAGRRGRPSGVGLARRGCGRVGPIPGRGSASWGRCRAGRRLQFSSSGRAPGGRQAAGPDADRLRHRGPRGCAGLGRQGRPGFGAGRPLPAACRRGRRRLPRPAFSVRRFRLPCKKHPGHPGTPDKRSRACAAGRRGSVRRSKTPDNYPGHPGQTGRPCAAGRPPRCIR
jgi:hypothetical protein